MGRLAGEVQSGMLTHVVQFYEDDESYCGMQVSFLDAALRAGDTGIVLATPAHLHVLQESLARLQPGDGPGPPAGYGKCVMLDAVQVLSRFIVDGRVDGNRFRDVMTGLLVQHVPVGGRRIWVFAEMVGLLVDEGKPEEALRLETCWVELARANRRYFFSMVCSYPQHALDRDSCRHWIPAICRAHTGVSLPR